MDMRPDRYLRLKAVLALVPVSRATLYAWIGCGTFPKQHQLGGGRAVGWLESEVLGWISTRGGRK